MRFLVVLFALTAPLVAGEPGKISYRKQVMVDPNYTSRWTKEWTTMRRSRRNELLEGIPLGRVNERILAEMANDVALFDNLLARALELGSTALGEAEPEGGALYLGDPATLLGQPEFSSAERMKHLFEAFEKKGLILKLLERAGEAPSRHVLIGEENPLADLRECSLVTAPYRRQGRVVGTVGVLGPTRMDYPRVVGLVDYTARLLGGALDTV